jgi:hypothetical protein
MTITPAEFRSELLRDSENRMAAAQVGRPGPMSVRDFPPATGNTAVDVAVDELRRLEADLRAARTQMRDLEASRRKVVEADRDALAAAIRAGKPDPGQKATTDHAAKLAETTRRAAALKTAVVSQERELTALLRQHAGEMAGRHAAEAAATRKRAAAALAELRAAAEVATQAEALSRWSRQVQANGRGHYSARAQRSLGKTGLAMANGEGFTVVALLDAVEATLDDVAG